MTTNRVGGAANDPEKDPSRRIDQQHRRIEQVEKVGEVENEQTRKKFKRFMEDEPEETTEKLPSPFEGAFYAQPSFGSPLMPPLAASPPDMQDILNDAIPDPLHAAPPTAQAPYPPAATQPLPQDQNFWSSTDTSFQKAPASPTYNQVEPPSKTSVGKGREKLQPGVPKDLKMAPPLPLQKDKTTEHSKKGAPPKKETPTLMASPFAPQEPPLGAPSGTKKPQDKGSLSSPKTAKAEPAAAAAAAPAAATPPLQPEEVFPSAFSGQQFQQFSSEDDEKKHPKSKITATDTEIFAKIPLPSNIIPLAEAATTQSAPYLNPQIIPLFFQMVGTIYMMIAKTGVSQTEILLNSPAFANSKFFGSKILIEKYATAPDSLNIRLTGTNEAVTSFQKNIPSLYAAFQNNNRSFKIGRITAEYATEENKPLFRRKGAKGGSSDLGGGFSDDRG